MTEQAYDRRDIYTPAPRPAWMQTLNEIGRGLDIAAVVPLTPQSLMQQASANTGLTDFGDDGWLEPFTVLMKAVDAEADLHLAGRLLTRAEFLAYLEARLRIVDWYRSHPEVEQEVVDRPVFITGYSRSGTTILFEVLSQDPQFRVAQKWESVFPVPPPQEVTYNSDPRIEKMSGLNQLLESMVPEFGGQHKMGAQLPCESLELEYLSFVSEVFLMIMQTPSYAAYLHGKDLTPTFEWQRTILKLLQSGYHAKHWLMKSPSHLPHLDNYLKVFPGMRVIFTHRDPIVTADSVISVLGTLFWTRTDDLWGDGKIDVDVMAMAEDRAKFWDTAIAMIEDGRLPRGDYANFYYDQFIADPMAAIRSIYDQLGMTLTNEAAERMTNYLAARTKGKHGQHEYEQAPTNVVESERVHYETYQRYFSVPNEI